MCIDAIYLTDANVRDLGVCSNDCFRIIFRVISDTNLLKQNCNFLW